MRNSRRREPGDAKFVSTRARLRVDASPATRNSRRRESGDSKFLSTRARRHERRVDVSPATRSS
eukprot:7570514-Alexandrium_andersonii.AAC.1